MAQFAWLATLSHTGSMRRTAFSLSYLGDHEQRVPATDNVTLATLTSLLSSVNSLVLSEVILEDKCLTRLTTFKCFLSSMNSPMKRTKLHQYITTTLFLTFGKQRDMDLCKFKASLDYRASSRIAEAKQRNPFLKSQKKELVFCDVPIYNSDTLETRWANLSDVQKSLVYTVSSRPQRVPQ